MVNSGLLEFSDDQKVRVDLDAETGEVVKAVTIDADDVETPIGGGGGSGDFSIIRVGLMVDQLPSEDQARIEFPATYSDAGLGDFATVLSIVPNTAGETKYENAVAYKGVCGVLVDKPSGYNVEIEGDGEFVDGMAPTAFCRGDCVIKILTETPK